VTSYQRRLSLLLCGAALVIAGAIGGWSAALAFAGGVGLEWLVEKW
jgi:hypothetical protein